MKNIILRYLNIINNYTFSNNFKKNLRKTIQLFFYYLIPIFLFLYIIIKINLGYNLYDEMKDYGNYAFKLLLLILFIKPLSVLFNKVNLFNFLLTYRRELGVLTFWFSIFHSFGLIYYLNLFNLSGLIKLLNPNELKLFSGLISFIGIFILGITSNKFSILRLKRNWKKVQYFVYPTFLFVVIHKYVSEGDLGPIIFLIVYIILKIFQFKFEKKTFKNNN